MDREFLIFIAAAIFFMAPMPYFTQTILNSLVEYNNLLDKKYKISIRDIKIQSLIFGVLWPIYLVMIIVSFIRVLMNPSHFDE